MPAFREERFRHDELVAAGNRSLLSAKGGEWQPRLKAGRDKLLRELNRQLDCKGLLVKHSTLVDASLIEAQTRPPRKDDPHPPKDADADWTVKNNQPTYGFKLHVGVDDGSGIIRKTEMTPASTHDSRVFEELLSGDERAVYADKAYDPPLFENAVQDILAFQPFASRCVNRPLTEWKRTWNRYLSAIRSPVERVFRHPQTKLLVSSSPLYRTDPEPQPRILAGDGLQPEKNDETGTRFIGPTAPGVRRKTGKPPIYRDKKGNLAEKKER